MRPLLLLFFWTSGASAPAAAKTPLAAVSTLVDQAQAAVVNVDVLERSGVAPPALSPWDHGSPDDASMRPGSGSGFVVDGNGLILTNQHLVENALLIYVTFADGQRLEAQPLGSDRATDVALLHVQDAHPVAPLKLGDSGKLQVGDWVVALGNPSGETVTASAGILSAKARNLLQRSTAGDFLQTDAAIYPGNSGGPLLNLKGEVVGLNTALIGGGTGVGFAVSSHALQALLPQLQRRGHAARGWLGAYVQELTEPLAKKLLAPVTHGAVVTYRMANSPAAHAGLQRDDVITRVDAQPVQSAAWLVHTLEARPPGSLLGMTIYRGKRRAQLRVRLGELPDWEPVGEEHPHGAPGSPVETMGFSVEPLNDGVAGARVAFVRPGSQAARAGLCEGTVVREVDGRPVRAMSQLETALREAPSGSQVLLRLSLPYLPYPRLRTLRIP